LSTHTLK
jgi:hypothetical protein